MPDTATRDPNRREIGKMVTDGLLAANGQVIRQAAKVMLNAAPRTARFLLKRIPGAPGFAMTAAETLQSKAPWRPVVGGALSPVSLNGLF